MSLHPDEPKTGLATTSLVLGLLGVFCGFTSIFAVICGHIALHKEHKEPLLYSGRRRALWGTILGYLAIVASAAIVTLSISLVKNPQFREAIESMVLLQALTAQGMRAVPEREFARSQGFKVAADEDGWVRVITASPVGNEEQFVDVVTKLRDSVKDLFGEVKP